MRRAIAACTVARLMNDKIVALTLTHQ